MILKPYVPKRFARTPVPIGNLRRRNPCDRCGHSRVASDVRLCSTCYACVTSGLSLLQHDLIMRASKSSFTLRSCDFVAAHDLAARHLAVVTSATLSEPTPEMHLTVTGCYFDSCSSCRLFS